MVSLLLLHQGYSLIKPNVEKEKRRIVPGESVAWSAGLGLPW